MNSRNAIRKAFPPDRFADYSYFYEAEPTYHFNSAVAFRLMILINRILPRRLYSNLFVFLRAK